MEDYLDVERHFPSAIAHLKTVPRSSYASEEQARREWHDNTHERNVDGLRPLHRETPEEAEGLVHSLFDEGGVDIRGGLREAVRRGHPTPGSPSTEAEALSPDILHLSGGDARRDGLALHHRSNAAPSDQTVEGDSGESEEFGDTPVQMTDMLRERLMELKEQKLLEDRTDTYMPRRLRLASDAEVAQAAAAVHRQHGELLALAQRAEPTSKGLVTSTRTKRAPTLADWNDLNEREDGPTEAAAMVPAILQDGVRKEARRAAVGVLDGATAYVPGASPTRSDERLRLLDDLLSPSGSSTSHERDGMVYLLRTLPRAGFCSRREAATIIAGGQVRVNNVVERNPFRLVRAEDDIHVAGHQSRLRFSPPRLWMYHKPAGVVVSRSDVAGRTLITKHARILGMDHLVPVGSLPMRAHGLLMLTNDGELSRFLENPKSMIQQTYVLRVRPAIDPVLAHKLNTEGININGRQYKGTEFLVSPGARSRYSVKVKVRGETMPIAHLMQHLGRVVERGGRTSFGPFVMNSLAVGSVREVTVPPFYSNHAGAVWQTFVERDWPYFRRIRVARLRRLSRYRELTPKELEELDQYTYEEVKEALSFEAQELTAAASERAARLSRRPSTLRETALADDFAISRARDDIATSDATWADPEDAIVEDITSLL